MSEKSNIVKAINKNVRSGARKANLVLNFIKGKKADIAIRDLEFTRKKVAEDIKKTVKSAVANAENKVTLSLSGWIEEDQEGTKRVGIQVQKVIGDAPKAVAAGTDAAPF